MKVVYLLQNPGIARCTPDGWMSAVVRPGPGGRYTSESFAELAEAEFIVVGLEPVSKAIFDAAPRLRFVQRLGVGYDNVDLDAAARRGVPVSNMPDFNAATVAEHAVALVLCLQRRLFESTLLMKAGHWPLGTMVAQGIYELLGKSVGIVGMGKIGFEVARRLAAFQCPLLYYDRRRVSPDDERELGLESVSLDDLLRGSDIVTLHLPLTPETRHLLGGRELGLMKKTALLINTARGAIIDEAALAEALLEGSIAGAGLDVYSDEPPAPRDPLRSCKNVVLTPHMAGQTREAMDRMVTCMLDNLDRVARGVEPRYRVV
jgi:phosphoglycerate dehydrogenase-like enzyme